MIRLYCWDAASGVTSRPWPAHLTGTAAQVTGDAVVWIDLENPTPEEEEEVLRRFLPVHTLTFEDVTRDRRLPDQGAHLPKVEEFPDYLLVIVNPLPWELSNGKTGDPSSGDAAPPPARKPTASGRWVRPQLSGVFTQNVLVTHHYDRLSCVEAVRGQVERRGETARRGPDYLFHLILDEMVDEYAPVVDRFADRLVKLEAKLFRKPSRKVLAELLRLKRTVVFLRKNLTMEREVLARLTRGEFDLVAEREIVYYRNVYDHLVRYTELVEGAREMVGDMMQMHLSATSNRLSEIMKVLTMISVIILPMTLIAGVYGMNFEESEWPDFKTGWGFPFALGLMALTAVTALSLFRWRRWI
jgi:magnesium transporter